MVVKNSKKKSTAMMKAKKARSMGFDATVFKKKDGYGTSVTRKGSMSKMKSRSDKLISSRRKKAKKLIGGIKKRRTALTASRIEESTRIKSGIKSRRKALIKSRGF